MIKAVITFICCCLAVLVRAQIVTVTDAETGQPLESVVLMTANESRMAVTNAEGKAHIGDFGEGDTVEVRLLGYRPQVLAYGQLREAGYAVALERGNVSLDNVVVSAARWSQPAKDLPVHVAVIGPKEVALYSPQTAADLLGTSGQVFIQKSQQGGGSPMIRGFATNRLLISVDGVRMNTAIFRSGNLQNVISLDPFATERTEVIFGPGSVIYGSDAIGGVMSFHTLTPQFSLQDEPFVKGGAVARVSSANNEQTGHLDFNVGWKKWAVLGSFSHNDYGHLRMGAHGPDDYLRPFYVQRIDSVDRIVTNEDPLLQMPTAYRQNNLMQKIRFAPNRRWDITYAFHYSATSDYSRYDRHIRYRNGLPRSGEWAYGPQIWQMNHVSVTHTPRAGLYDQLALRLAHQFFEESRIDRDINDTQRRTRLEKVNALSANLDFTKSLKAGQKLFYGLEAVYNDVNSTGTDEDISTGIVAPGPARYPQAEWSSYAAYLSWQKKLNTSWLFQAGSRYNSFGLEGVFDTNFYPFPFTTASIASGALTGSAGLVFTPSEQLTLSANLSTGFRSPNVDDVGKVFDSEPGSVVVPNPDLGPEYAYNADLGIAKVFGGFLKADLTAFYTILENAMVRRDHMLGGQDSIVYDGVMSKVQAIQNAARATVYGLQAGIEITLPQGFAVSSRYNVQKGEEELDDGSTSPSRHAAPAFGATHLTYRFQSLLVDFYAQYSAGIDFDNLPDEEQGKTEIYARDANGDPYSPSWHTLNLKVLQRFGENFIVSGGVENLTDRRYRPYSSGVAATGRNFVLSLRANF